MSQLSDNGTVKMMDRQQLSDLYDDYYKQKTYGIVDFLRAITLMIVPPITCIREVLST
jgi:hypothetical protein